jgi:3'-phosphoadenosine 5'-phosphosulfate sulfotransferase (PAPS reductase)/FAD synthetase
MSNTNPYRIEGPALVSFSGGRTSAYMLWHILDAWNGKLPADVHVCFANTGKEREETLRFVHECGTRWGVRVRWLEYRSRLTSIPIEERFAEVGYNSASRDGEPFAALIASKGYTPNAVTRFCTSELKVRVMKWFMQSLGYKNWLSVIGLRHDERHRVAKSRKKPKEPWTNSMPLDAAKISNRDVRAFWNAQDFDLQLLPFEGNCDGCFLKARPKLWEIERTKSGTLQWWADREAEIGGQFVTEYSYAELIRDVRRQPDLFLGVFDDEQIEMDAECGLWCGGE